MDTWTFLGIADYPAFCVAVLLFLALPGPGTFALLTATGQGGMRAGAAATLGLIAGDQALLWMAVAGVAALLASYPSVFTAVQWFGAVYLAWIGIQLLRARGATAAHPISIRPGHYTRQAFFITVLNPKAILFYMAFFPLFIRPDTHPGLSTFVAMAGTIALLSGIYCLLLCAAAQAVSRLVQAHPRWALALQRLAGVFLIAFGLRLLKD